MSHYEPTDQHLPSVEFKLAYWFFTNSTDCSVVRIHETSLTWSSVNTFTPSTTDAGRYGQRKLLLTRPLGDFFEARGLEQVHVERLRCAIFFFFPGDEASTC